MTQAGGLMYSILDQKKFDRLVNDGAVIPFNAPFLLAQNSLNCRKLLKKV